MAFIVVKNVSLKRIIFYLIFEFILAVIVMPLLIFYGPYTNIRDTLVTTAMTTLSHKYLVTWFLPKSKIDEIMKEMNNIKTENSNQGLLNFKNIHDSTIELNDVYSKHFKGKIILIHDPTRIQVGISSKLPKEGETTSEIAKNYNAVAAINAGGFLGFVNGAWTGSGGIADGIIIHNGKMLYNNVSSADGTVDLVGFTYDGKLLVGKHTPQEIKRMSIKEAVSFRPPLIVNGKPMIKNGDGGWGIAPRTAIGQRRDGTVIFLVIDGRAISSVGATLKDVQNIMLDYGAYNAANLDGGSSTTMYFKGKVINNPSNPLGERTVPTIFFAK
ncbi:phosphodiester glycosidase family protein [Aceticella autotrophica]|uniref:Phosphodiester glycosidase family protein n=1 Tax=Aceticella autotrophica TaxID=2755338 RepID=A0A975AWH7_9THEO|nr:phosphodiester glycosidase family protein [Aceticella autotrophica]QSZ27734.1 phosphodiester glycosidase family protein [Aceticella autotrophica]